MNGTWSTTTFRIFLLFRTARRPDVPWSGKILFGAMRFGWGLFNVVEGVMDHPILQIHHVYERQEACRCGTGYFSRAESP